MGGISLDRPRVHSIRTPEGASVPFSVAPAGDRAAAFLFDLMIIAAATALVWILEIHRTLVENEPAGHGLSLVTGFLLWNFYFVWFEVHRGGVTPGKRGAEIRVIARGGGPLTAEAVFARNLMRNLELCFPALALSQMLSAEPDWRKLCTLAWMLVFTLMPLFNPDRLRCGDLVAGTLVVKVPQAVLLEDLAARRATGPELEIAFTSEQLDIYGIHELQVLEGLLRRHEGTLEGRILDDVATKIKTKIDWPRERWNVPVRPFLVAFYRAQRGSLEKRILLGQRLEWKKR